MESQMTLTSYRTLGRSGLVVSPLALGTMTFGTARWGSDEAASRAVFDAYVDAGGNFIDTADIYSAGESEAMLGRFIAARGLRDRLVIGTKSGFATGAPLVGGNGAKHIHTALAASLARLQTDYIDLYWIHIWDGVTPAAELLETMAGLVRQGRIRYWGMSNAPAWYVAQLVTLAAARGLPGPIAMQYFHSLVSREIEAEHLPLAQATGMGLVPWSPLAFGFLTGKYDRATVEAAAPREGGDVPREAATQGEVRAEGDNRLDGANPFGDSLFTDRNWRIVDVLKQVAAEVEATPAAVALAWVVGRAGVSSTLMGVSSVKQMEQNVAALDLVLPKAQQEALDAASTPDLASLYALFSPAARQHVVFSAEVTA
jgi:aryl-alcohol dehydrogenase-like predicted oxidoreductase